jgi:3-(3-hydroxy-phenyl)propionate hydroxylase
MTGGQDRAAAVRRIALAAAVRSDRICQAMGSTATPRLKAGALQPSPRRFLPSGSPPAVWAGGLIPNPLVSAGDSTPVRLDAILAGRPAVLTARRPDAGLAGFCRRHGLVLARISASGTGTPTGPDVQPDAGWIDVHLAGDAAAPAGLRALVADPALAVLVRPDRVVAAVGTRSRLPRLPWYLPAAAWPERPATAPPAAHLASASPVTTTP